MKTVRIVINEHERFPFITFNKVEKDYEAGYLECAVLVSEEKAKEWTEALTAFEKMQDELDKLQDLFYEEKQNV